MTTFEHAMLGATGAVAIGLHHRSWQIVAMAGIVAVLPDWDGLSILFGAVAFDQVHRAVGHSVFVATPIAAVAAFAEYRLRLLDRIATFMGNRIEGMPASIASSNTNLFKLGGLVWIITAILATWSHLAADLLFSGHARLSDWGLKLFWPISQKAYVYPAVRWGDPMPTLILVAGMFAMLRWRPRAQGVAALTLFALVGYIASRAFLIPY